MNPFRQQFVWTNVEVLLVAIYNVRNDRCNIKCMYLRTTEKGKIPRLGDEKWEIEMIMVSCCWCSTFRSDNIQSKTLINTLNSIVNTAMDLQRTLAWLIQIQSDKDAMCILHVHRLIEYKIVHHGDAWIVFQFVSDIRVDITPFQEIWVRLHSFWFYPHPWR